METSFPYNFDYIPIKTPYNRRPAIKMDPMSITIHNSENPSSTAKNERNWLTNPSNTSTVSYHIIIDEYEAIEAIPLNEVAWHIEDESIVDFSYQTSIAIVVCESGDIEATLDNTIELVANLLAQRKWGVNRLKRHYDWSGKNCPRLFNQDGKWTGWKQFVNRVQARLDQLAANAKPNLLEQQGQHISAQEEEGTKRGIYIMNVADANKIIQFLNAAYNATSNGEARKEFNRLANELRKASGQKIN